MILIIILQLVKLVFLLFTLLFLLSLLSLCLSVLFFALLLCCFFLLLLLLSLICTIVWLFFVFIVVLLFILTIFFFVVRVFLFNCFPVLLFAEHENKHLSLTCFFIRHRKNFNIERRKPISIKETPIFLFTVSDRYHFSTRLQHSVTLLHASKHIL